MLRDDLKLRTKDFAVRIIRLYAALPKTTEAQVVGKQMLRFRQEVGELKAIFITIARKVKARGA